MHLLCSCCGLAVFASLVIWAVVRLSRWWHHRKLVALAHRVLALTDVFAPPRVLGARVPRELPWTGGYVSGGLTGDIPRYLAFLRTGIPTRGVVLEAFHTRDDEGINFDFSYGFRDRHGEIRVVRSRGGVDTVHAALSSRRGQLSPYFDLDPSRGQPLVILLDPHSEDHLIYDALFVDEAAAEAALPPE